MTATASAMTKDVGVWPAAGCALVLIDCDESSYVTGIDVVVDGGMKVW